MSRTAEQIAADRARYEEHQRKGLQFAPKALPGAEPAARRADRGRRVIHTETIPGGWYWSTQLQGRRGAPHRAGPTASAVRRAGRLERRRSERAAQPARHGQGAVDHQRRQGPRAVLRHGPRAVLGHRGLVRGAHDALIGGSTAASNAARYPGDGTRNTRDNLVLVAGKLGLDRRDIPSALTFFAPVRVEAGRRASSGAPSCASGGDYVDLRAEMDLLVALLELPASARSRPGLCARRRSTVTRYRAPPPAADDLCRTATAEAVRGFENNALAEA